jgi:hypothetical protein
MLFKGQQIVVLVGAWVLLLLALLTLFGSLSYEFFYVIAFLGFLILASAASPYVARPRWKSRLNYVTAAGTLIFVLIVAQQFLTIWSTMK